MSANKAKAQARGSSQNYQHQNLEASQKLSSPDRTQTHNSTNSQNLLNEKFEVLPNVSEKYQMERMP